MGGYGSKKKVQFRVFYYIVSYVFYHEFSIYM